MPFITRKELGGLASDVTIACTTTFVVCFLLELWQKGIVARYVNMDALLAVTLLAAVLAVVITPSAPEVKQ